MPSKLYSLLFAQTEPITLHDSSQHSNCSWMSERIWSKILAENTFDSCFITCNCFRAILSVCDSDRISSKHKKTQQSFQFTNWDIFNNYFLTKSDWKVYWVLSKILWHLQGNFIVWFLSVNVLYFQPSSLIRKHSFHIKLFIIAPLNDCFHRNICGETFSSVK